MEFRSARRRARGLSRGKVARGVVRKGGLEPPRLAALVPKTRASTNSATFARLGFYGSASPPFRGPGWASFEPALPVSSEPGRLIASSGIGALDRTDKWPPAPQLRFGATQRVDIIGVVDLAQEVAQP